MNSFIDPRRHASSEQPRRGRRTQKKMAAELEELRRKLDEAEETLRAIRSGEVDALVVSTTQGEQVFTLQGADRSYRDLMEEMNEGALSLTAEGLILYANRMFAAMLRAPLEKVIGSSIQDWIGPESRSTLQVLLEAGRHKKCREELRLSARDGTQVPVYLSVSPVVMDGTRACLGAVATDLTVQKRADERLRLSEAQFRHVFENSPLGKSLQTMDGEVRVNKTFCDILGYTAEELQSKPWQDITHPDDLEATQQAMESLLSGAASNARFEKRYIHKSGAPVWTDVTISMGKDPSGKPLYVLTMINDITARKQTDAALLEMKQHLQRNIEMERLRLAQELHDVPLQQLYAVIYELEELRTQARPGNVPVIQQAIVDIQTTLNTLRSTATELRPPALSSFGLEKAIRSYIADFRDKHPEIQVKYALARDAQLLPETVRLVLFRVLQEAMANIMRHAQASEIQITFSFDAEEARLEIADNGQGFSVPENWLSMVLAGHYGLAGMAERVSAAGGTLNIRSAPGSSTRIQVVVPYNGM